MTYSTAQCN
jgi:hypothetical protein